MPPKPKFSKEEIILAAQEIVKESGIDAVVAREVARKLGATTGPIFTYYNTMEELKEDIYHLTMEQCVSYMSESLKYFPAFKEFGLRWTRYAVDYPHLYSMLFLLNGVKKDVVGFVNSDFMSVITPMVTEVAHAFDMPEQEAVQLVNHMLCYSNGIASLCANRLMEYDPDKICYDLSEMCISLVNGYRIRTNQLNPEQAQVMYQNASAYPHLK